MLALCRCCSPKTRKKKQLVNPTAITVFKSCNCKMFATIKYLQVLHLQIKENVIFSHEIVWDNKKIGLVIVLKSSLYF